MNQLEFLLRLAVSLAIGGLIGLEREQHRERELVIAGVRTYPLISVGGMLFAYLEMATDVEYAVTVGLGAFAAMAIVYAWIRHSLRLTGLTSPVALLVTYIIGVLIGYGYFIEGVAVGVATTFLLLAKGKLHAFAEAVTEAEMMGALQFILVAFILYPITLSVGEVVIRGFNLSKIVNLSAVVLTIILVSLLSFVSFLAIRYFGARKGLAVTGALGGLVNSEAAAASLAAHVRKYPATAKPATAGVLLANTGMLARNILISALSDTTLGTAIMLLLPSLLMASLGVFYYIWSVAGATETKGKVFRMESPFAMRPALVMGLLIGLISVVVYLFSRIPSGGGSAGIYMTALAGFVSSAAVVFSVSTLAFTGHLSPLLAGEVAVLACLMSTLNKLMIVRAGSKELSQSSRAMIAATFGVGLIGLVAMELYLRGYMGWS
ncbi:MAG: DUF4010 domain-containing protein [Thermoplasmata archaeon]